MLDKMAELTVHREPRLPTTVGGLTLPATYQTSTAVDPVHAYAAYHTTVWAPAIPLMVFPTLQRDLDDVSRSLADRDRDASVWSDLSGIAAFAHEQQLSPESMKLLASGEEDVRAGRTRLLDPADLAPIEDE